MIWTPKMIRDLEWEYRVKFYETSNDMYNVDGSIFIYKKYENSITEFLPQIHTINGNFSIVHSNIIDLQGGPIFIMNSHGSNGYFECSNNPMLKSLKGAPRKVSNEFDCKYNPNLLFTYEELYAMNIGGSILIDTDNVVPTEPSEFIPSLPI